MKSSSVYKHCERLALQLDQLSSLMLQGVLLWQKNPALLLENGGHLVLSKSWAHYLIIRMRLLKRKASTKTPKMTTKEFEQKKVAFLKQVSAFVAVHTIPSALVLNWDQTGINVVPSAEYTMEQRGS